jgi:tetratricopeptide (TPR) repeat protein
MTSPYGTEEELLLFSDRIARSLRDRPQGMEAAAHREQVAGLVRHMGEANLYEFLGIEPTASALEVHEGFERTARLVHRDNASRLGFSGREGALEVLFERAVEAYLTLSAIDRRKRYDREQGPRLWKRAVAPKVTPDEEAARLYARARSLATAGQIHPAIELLRDSIRIQPRAEFLALLGTLEAKNPNWLEAAEAHLVQALEIGPKIPGVEEGLASVREKLARLAAGQPLEDAKDGDEDGEVRIL